MKSAQVCFLLFGFITALFIQTPNALAASFDCDGKKSILEIFICSSSDLSVLDEQVAAEYQRTHKGLAGDAREQSLQAQRDFLKRRIEDCPIVLPADDNISDAQSKLITSCFQQVYKLRLQVLTQEQHAVPAESPAQATTTNTPEKSQLALSEISQPPTPQVTSDAPPIVPETSSTPVNSNSNSNPESDHLPASTDVSAASTSSTDPDSGGSISIIGVIILVVFIGFAGRLGYKLWKKGRNLQRHLKVKKIYAMKEDLVQFAPREEFLSLYNSTPASDIAFVPLLLSCDAPRSSATADWRGEQGVIDDAAYHQALATYSQSMNQWQHNKSEFDREQETMKKLTNSIGSAAKYSVSRPNQPSRNDFIRYHPQTGKCKARVTHDPLLSSIPTNIEVHTPATQYVLVDPTPIEENILKAYKSVLPRLASGMLKVRIGSATPLPPMGDGDLMSKVGRQLLAALKENAESQLGKYYHNITLTDKRDVDMTRTSFQLPVAAIIINQSNGKAIVHFHDHLEPTIHLGKVQAG